MLYDHNDSVDALDGENHQMESDEFKAAHPYLTLKQCLVGNAGMSQPPEDTDQEYGS